MEIIGSLPEIISLGSALGLVIDLLFGFYIVVLIVANCIIFRKMGLKPYKAIIPFYCDFMAFRALRMSFGLPIAYTVVRVLRLLCNLLIGASAYMMIISFAIVILAIIMFVKKSIRYADYFGKSQPFKLGLILMHPVFLIILAFGRSRFLINDVSEAENE